MPDVIVKGMEMPTSCESCPCKTADAFGGLGCQATGYIPLRKANQDRPDWCPLRPAPEWIILALSKYAENKARSWIRDPAAYTLHEVWKIMDSKVSYGPSKRGDGDGC